MLEMKERANIWKHFTVDVKGNKMLCKPCGASLTGKNTFTLYNLVE